MLLSLLHPVFNKINNIGKALGAKREGRASPVECTPSMPVVLSPGPQHYRITQLQ